MCIDNMLLELFNEQRDNSGHRRTSFERQRKQAFEKLSNNCKIPWTGSEGWQKKVGVIK